MTIVIETKERPVPTWANARFGDAQTIQFGFLEVTIQSKMVSKTDPTTFEAIVSGRRLKANKPNREEMTSYAMRTVKSWLANATADLEAFEAAQNAAQKQKEAA